MLKKVKYFIIIAIVSFIFSSCGRKMIPSSVTGLQGKNYEKAEFGYRYVEAIKQKLLGNEGDALKYLEQCIRIDPQSDAAYYQMAQIVLSNGDIENGKKYAARALSIEPENLWYLMMMAGIQYQEKNLDSTIIYYEKALKYFPEKNDIKLTLGNLYSENRNFEKAKALFDSLDEELGVNESTTLAAIKSLMSAKNYDEAFIKTNLLLKEYPDEILYYGLLAEIYRGMGENVKAMEVYKKLFERNPDNPQTQLSLCDFLITEKSYDELFMLLNTIMLNSKVKKEDKISLLARLMEIPEIISDKGDNLMMAIMVLEANYKEDDIISILRPELLIKQQKLEESSWRLEEIIKDRPENYYAWEKLLLVYLQLKEYGKLMIKGEECATLFNRSFFAKILYANGAIESNKYSIALEELRKADILAGDNKDFKIQVLTMRADVYYRMKDYAKAFEIFEEAVKTGKEDLTVLNNYAYYLAEQNMKLKEAEKMAEKVIEKESENATYLDTYGWVLYKRGKLKDAAKIMEKIIKSGKTPDAEWFEHWTIAIKMDSTKTNLIKEIENCKR